MSWYDKLKDEALRTAKWILGRLDTLAALLGGVTVAVLAWAGHLSEKDLGTATLTLLSVLAFSMVVERSLRLKTSKGIEEARADLTKTRETLKALEVGSPYYVTESDCTGKSTSTGGAQALDGSIFGSPKTRWSPSWTG